MRSKSAGVDWFIAIRAEPTIGGGSARSILDMCRYDRCYPVSNQPRMGWMVLIQPYRAGIGGGFTVGRWESFGFKLGVTMPAPVTGSGLVPYPMLAVLQDDTKIVALKGWTEL